MVTDQQLIGKLRSQIESGTGWGNSEDWTNHDFVVLSDKIRERTGVALSHVTLKRIWGKVKYESLPNVHTLSTLARFAGYEDWRDFRSKNGNGAANDADGRQLPGTGKRLVWTVSAAAAILLTGVIALVPGKRAASSRGNNRIDPADYSLTTKKVVSTGLPNSVVFDYEATKAPEDSVTIQQSWDVHLRTRVPRSGHQHTCIYYYPDYFYAKLIVGDRIVKQQPLFIQSDGWMAMVERPRVPVYFRKQESFSGGRMGVSLAQLHQKNVELQPDPPMMLYTNVRDFGEVYSDDFVFETSLRNDYSEGSSVCQVSRVYLLCEGTAIWVPLSAKGCISDLDLLFTHYYTSGHQQDLSAFGVDFRHDVTLRIESHGGHARILIDGKPVYSIDHNIIHSRIIGINFRFEGTGSVDYVRLSNDKVRYDEEFNQR